MRPRLLPRDRTAGFTLLELLVAVSVLGLLSVAIARGLGLGSDGWTRAHAATKQAERLRDARHLLVQVVTGATPVFATNDLNDRTVAFAGTQETMGLITRLPQSAGMPLMVAARLSVQNQALVLDWRPDLPRSDNGGPLPETRYVIAPRVAAVRFDYFDAVNGWQAEWTGRAALPGAIRITIQDDNAGRTVWPTLIIQTRATGTPSCLYDATDLECQREPG